MKDTKIDIKVRLLETESGSSGDTTQLEGVYACLSYCWGKSKNGITTLSNVSERRTNGIPLHSLPSTVRDAILLCHKLNIQYIWVDRLCIIQDDPDDWATEAAKMAEVYGNSSLTITTILCTDADQSFLDLRKQQFRYQEPTAEIICSQRGTPGLAIKPSSCLFIYGLFTVETKYARDSPFFLERSIQNFYPLDNSRHGTNSWLSRGWTFQEWMLSPRLLHIHQLTLWDCFDGYSNEFTSCMIRSRVQRSPEDLIANVPWIHIVDEFAGRCLSNKTDALPALAGLAKRYEEAGHRTYVHGLFLEDMPTDLLWQSVNHWDNERSIGMEYAPSWTWAKRTGPIRTSLLPRDHNERSQIISHASIIRPSVGDPRLENSLRKDGSIDIDGPVCQVIPGPVVKMFHRGLFIGPTVAGWSEKHVQDWTLNFDQIRPFEDWQELLTDSRHYLLLIHNGRCGGVQLYAALILESCGTIGEYECFERAGVAFWRHDNGDDTSAVCKDWDRRRIRLR